MTSESILQRVQLAPTPTRGSVRPARRNSLVPANSLAEAKSLLDKGKTCEAFAVLKQFGELKDLAGTEARLLGGELAKNLGAPRLSRYLQFRAWRSARNSVEAQAAGLGALVDVAGIHAVWRRLKSLDEKNAANRGTENLWLLRAWVAACFKDFETADNCWQKAEQIAPKNAALFVSLASILERESRFDEALLAARKAIALRPGYPNAHRAAGHLLQLLNREAESLAALEEGAGQVQSVPLLLDLAQLQAAMEKYSDANATMDTVIALSPILEPEIRQWALSFQSRVAWQAGKISVAITVAREHGSPAALRFAERLASAELEPRRVQLAVPFVRQQQDTCAPATLTALSRFWNRPAEHLEVAQEICYTGTPQYATRVWAEQHGWVAREFTLTWEAAKGLLDRGIPFALFTQAAASGHAQAVVGYDEAQETLIVRDSNFHQLIEYTADHLLEEQRLSGPAALVFVPQEQAQLLEGVQLPESKLRDKVHLFDQARESHRRDQAAQILEALKTEAPAHPLTIMAEMALAAYDGNTPLTIGCVERLLELHPENERLQLQKLSWLSEQNQRAERLQLLAQACARHGCAPAFMVQYANELQQDARNLAYAGSWARRAMRKDFDDRSAASLANVLWAQRLFAESFDLHRFTACLNDKNEAAARDYYLVARQLNRAEEALSFLEARFKRYGAKSPFPAISLCVVLHHVCQPQRAAEVLKEALKLRADDGELLLYAAQTEVAEGRVDQAEAYLQRAQGHIADSKLSRARARLAARQQDLKPALALWRKILEREPLALDAHHEVALILAQTEGRLAAIKHLEQVCAANPNNFGLHQQLLGWLREDGARAVQPVLDRLIEQNPASASLHCERARWYGLAGLWADALKEAQLAVELDPNLPGAHAVLGWVLKSDGQFEAAVDAYRRALTVSVDFEGSMMAGLLACCCNVIERRLAINFLQTELSRHLIYGSGLLAFREIAARYVDAEDALKMLQKVLNERPDLWHAWATVIRELTAQRQFDEAIDVAEKALSQFPFSAELWEEAAVLQQARKEVKRELAAREKVVELCPGNIQALRNLASTLQRAEQPDRAIATLEQALQSSPRDAATLFLLARAHWKAGAKDKAINCARDAVWFNPDFAPAWDSLQSWGAATGKPRLDFEIAKNLADHRRDDPDAWLRLGRLLWRDQDIAEALRVIDLAIAMRLSCVDAHILRVQILAAEERFAEAHAGCSEKAWGGPVPAELRAVEACVLDAEGRRQEAIEKMEAALADAPGLIWAWQNLADWHLAEKEVDEAKDVIERLSRAIPNNPTPLLRAAAARHRAGDFPEASDLLEKALLADPGCIEARKRLMVIQVQTNQFNALRDTIITLRQFGVEDWALSAEGCVALKQRDVGFAAGRLNDLCSMPNVDSGAVDMLAGAFFNFGLAAEMREPLKRALKTSEPYVGTGALLVAVMCAQKRLPSLGWLFRLQASGRVGQRAAIQYFRSLGSLGEKQGFANQTLGGAMRGWKMLRLKQRFSDWLEKDSEAWIEFGSALLANHQEGAARRWLKDWRSRPKLRRHYYILFELLTQLGLDTDALSIGHEALRQTGGSDRIRALFKLACLEANLGDTKAAAKLIEQIEQHNDSSLNPLLVVLKWVIRVREAKPEARAQEAKDGFHSITLSLSREYLKNSPAFVRRYVGQSIRFLSTNGAGLKARTWAASNT